MTREELVARLLYRDGLMLVVDKPAGIAVHRGPKGGENLEDYFDALRFGLPRTRRWRIGSIATRPAALCSAAIARRCSG
jgi:23S rRNA-/tRNA-specific pseudouridylate synthase